GHQRARRRGPERDPVQALRPDQVGVPAGRHAVLVLVRREALEDRAGDHAPEARVRNPGPAPIHSVPAPASALRIAAAASAPGPTATAIASGAGRVTSPAAHTRGREVARLACTTRNP